MLSNNQNAISDFNYDDESLNIDDLEFSFEEALKLQLSDLSTLEE